MKALTNHWRVYSMEAICLGIFMISASFFATLLESPKTQLHHVIDSGFLRLCVMGAAMGLTCVGLNYSPMGKISGAHMNPAVTIAFLRLRKIKLVDALYYILFQLAGGIAAVTLMSPVLGNAFRDAPVNYIITVPGENGIWAAFAIECLMSFLMMAMVLYTSNHPKLKSYTGAVAGVLVATFIIFSAPISGFSINPARTLASAVPAMQYPSLWIYLSAPFIGMLAAAEAFLLFQGHAKCAKMHHADAYPCIFHCDYCKHGQSEQMIADDSR